MVLDLSRLDSKWEHLLIHTFRTEDIIKDMNSINHQIESTLFHQFGCSVANKLVWFWHCRVKLCLFPVLCVGLALFALIVVLAEVSVFSRWFEVVNVFRLVHRLSTFVTIDVITAVT